MTQTVSTESPMEPSPRERLIRIMKREQALFIRQTLSQKPGYRGGKKAFEYFIRQKIVKAVEAGCGNNTLRKEFLRAKGWDAPDDFDINDEEE